MSSFFDLVGYAFPRSLGKVYHTFTASAIFFSGRMPPDMVLYAHKLSFFSRRFRAQNS
jgi:hypothetical protein